jgi:hypothetical protein
MWIVLILFAGSTFSAVVDSAEECLAFAEINRPHWIESGQTALVACMRTVDI